METKDKRTLFQRTTRVATIFVAVAMFLCSLPLTVIAETAKIEVEGEIYEFAKDSHYEIYEDGIPKETRTGNTYGTFYISGDVVDVSEKSGVPSYEVGNGNLAFYYNHGDTMLNADEDFWHLIDDKSRKVADMKLDSNIMKGAIILQTSKDQKNWVDAEIICNAFSDTPIRTNSIYSTTDVQLINGCYYRVLVVYELSIRTEDSNFLFINTDKYEYKKCAEVYEFYAYMNSGETNVVDPNQTYSLGEKVRTKNFDGYFGEELIDKNDIHYGWELGSFFVSGYTDEVADTDGNTVFLKNVGDKVTLWFNLNQNIDSLNGKENLSITADTEGYDQYFETSKMNFGRGALIIRYTDYNNVKSEPTIYTNYLEANALVGADTKVQLFEEGDYEVALDYEITSDELIDKIGHYRIFFKFSVRNGNCMVYPFDVKTGSELTNSSMTENGFRLDLAKSRYLKINLKRETLKDNIVDVLKDMPGYIGSNGRTEEEIFEAERELGTLFAKDYCAYLKEIGLACFDGHEFTGLTKTARLNVVSVTKEQREYFDRATSSLYVIEEVGIDGIIIWQNSNGTVYAATPNSKAKKIADSLSEYISK